MNRNADERRAGITWWLIALFLCVLVAVPSPGAPGPPPREARSVILLIGDGMGAAQIEAARWWRGGPDGELQMDRLAVKDGLTRTRAALGMITDSAAAATALACGVKTIDGFVGIGPTFDRLTSIVELARHAGMAVGLVTTVPITHATPAGFGAHVGSRYETDRIAEQLLQGEIDVLLGGGESGFVPPGAASCHWCSDRRSDGRNLKDEAIAARYVVVCDAAAFAALDLGETDRVLGLFAADEMPMPYAPTLAEMTDVAIEILSRDPDGFFLMVEGGQIDWACHDNDAEWAIATTLGFDEAAGVAIDFADQERDVLVIVTADHETGGMGVSTTATGAATEDGPFSMPSGEAFYVTWSGDDHTARDVPTMGSGPGAERLSGTYENTWIFDVMIRALGLPDPRRPVH